MRMNWLRGAVLLAVAIPPGLATASISQACLPGEYLLTCDVARLDDARAVDDLVAPVLRHYGWDRGCYSVEYLRNDSGGPTTIMLVLHGGRGMTAPACRELMPPVTRAEQRAAGITGATSLDEAVRITARIAQRKGEARAAPVPAMKKMAGDLRGALRAAPPGIRACVLRQVDELHLGNEWGGEAVLPLP